MRRNFTWKWEKLDENTQRAKVIGGWVLLTTSTVTGTKGNGISETTVFIPDSDHLWNIIPEAKETAVHTPKIKAADFEAPSVKVS